MFAWIYYYSSREFYQTTAPQEANLYYGKTISLATNEINTNFDQVQDKKYIIVNQDTFYIIDADLTLSNYSCFDTLPILFSLSLQYKKEKFDLIAHADIYTDDRLPCYFKGNSSLQGLCIADFRFYRTFETNIKYYIDYADSNGHYIDSLFVLSLEYKILNELLNKNTFEQKTLLYDSLGKSDVSYSNKKGWAFHVKQHLDKIDKNKSSFIFPIPYSIVNPLIAYDQMQEGYTTYWNFEHFIRMFYFSTVTITTLGFGDIVPITTKTRLLVSIESIWGIIVIGLFLNSLTRKIIDIKRGDSDYP